MRRFRHPLVSLALFVVAVFSLGSSLFAEDESRVTIISSPAGAEVVVDGTLRGITPIELFLKRNVEHAIRIECAGFETSEARVVPAFRGSRLRRLAVSGFLAGAAEIAIEESTGSGYDLEPAELIIVLRRTSPAAVPVLCSRGLTL